MNDIVTDASDYRSDVHRRAVAHELSAEWHRKWVLGRCANFVPDRVWVELKISDLRWFGSEASVTSDCFN